MLLYEVSIFHKVYYYVNPIHAYRRCISKKKVWQIMNHNKCTPFDSLNHRLPDREEVRLTVFGVTQYRFIMFSGIHSEQNLLERDLLWMNKLIPILISWRWASQSIRHNDSAVVGMVLRLNIFFSLYIDIILRKI